MAVAPGQNVDAAIEQAWRKGCGRAKQNDQGVRPAEIEDAGQGSIEKRGGGHGDQIRPRKEGVGHGGVAVARLGMFFQDPEVGEGGPGLVDKGKMADDGHIFPPPARRENSLPEVWGADLRRRQQGIGGGHGQGSPIGCLGPGGKQVGSQISGRRTDIRQEKVCGGPVGVESGSQRSETDPAGLQADKALSQSGLTDGGIRPARHIPANGLKQIVLGQGSFHRISRGSAGGF